MGEVASPPLADVNHSSMASRSYEKPSEVDTGSAMICEVIGQKKEDGTDAIYCFWGMKS